MVRKKLVKRLDVWFTWNHEREERKLEELSRQGLHLERPGMFRSAFSEQPRERYLYRLDYQPNLKKGEQKADYLNLYCDSGWEYKGSCVNWYYFRRAWADGELGEIYTDKESLKQFYQRIQRIMGIVLLCNLLISFFNTRNLFADKGENLPWMVMTPVLCLQFVAMILLAYGCLRLQKKINRVESV
jgi:hypothetical protein